MISSHCSTEKNASLISSASVFLGGLVIILLLRAIRSCFKRCSKTPHEMRQKKKNSNSIQVRVIHFVEMTLSAQTFIGKILVIGVFVLTIITVIIYFILSTFPLESCDYPGKMTAAAEVLANGFFALYFGLRFIAASDKLKFWLELNSIVDFLTIPPVCVLVYLGKNWLGLRFIRALRLLELPKILLLLKITKTSAAIKLSNLLAVFLSSWLTAAGFLHLIENTGDLWIDYDNSQRMNYLECIYMLMVTMSTVGYGDITAKTTQGRIFMIFFIVGGLALFASHAPEIVDIVGSTKKYNGTHVVMGGRKHVVVCGYITLDSVNSFLKDFMDRDKGRTSTEVIFMGEIIPNLELETLLKRYHAQTTFFYGSVLNVNDLKRVKMDRADACLVLADKHSSDPEHEDACNIMRVISIKHYYPQTRVITQILQTYSKEIPAGDVMGAQINGKSKPHLHNIPGWNWNIGDSIICLSELRLGFMAQSSLVPGLSTVLINLCSVTDNIQVDENSWWWHYLDSINNRLMTSVLSNAFVGMSFNEVCRVCFIQMDIVLVAIEYRSNSGVSILVNPRAQVKLHENTVGFFIARSCCEVQRSSVYCTVCHNDISNPLLIKKCACKSPSPGASSEHIMLTPVKSLDKLSLSDIRHLSSETDEEGQTALDSTGMFHWCKEVPLEKAVLTHKAAVNKNFHNHIVVSVFGDSNSTLIGLRDFVMPLRASNLTYDELKPIVFLGPLNYLEREWKYIENFPKLFVFPGSGLSRVNLRSVNIHSCSMCAIISSIWTGKTTQYMEDTECILSTLKMRSMIPEATAADSDLLCLSDQKKPAPRIPVITELKQASNITFIDEDSTYPQHPETNARLTTAFASGSVFSDCFLDSLMCMTYFNWQVLGLLQTLVTGGTTPELEEQLAEENALTNRSRYTGHTAPQDRCKLALIPLMDPNLDYHSGNTYGELFCNALSDSSIICFGIYRLMDDPDQQQRRYVITRPPKNFALLTTDQLYCVVPFRDQPSTPGLARSVSSTSIESLFADTEQ